MKRQLTKIVLLAFTVMLFAVGCGETQGNVGLGPAEGESDLTYVQSKGTFIAGITDFKPMDYRDGEKWTGFDAELAESFAESIGAKLELKEIDWDDRTKLLENGEIDCIWNGMTMTQELMDTISCSKPYLSNAQVVVMRKKDLENYKAIEECMHLLFAVEKGSAGEDFLKEKRYRYSVCDTQKDALQSVLDKKADAAVIDIIMAAYNTSDGRKYDKLGFSISLNDEKICVGFRKNSDLTQEADAYIQKVYGDKSIHTLAEKYGIEDAVLKEH